MQTNRIREKRHKLSVTLQESVFKKKNILSLPLKLFNTLREPPPSTEYGTNIHKMINKNSLKIFLETELLFTEFFKISFMIFFLSISLSLNKSMTSIR